MYRILLVDDEPLILSGIKFLINWESNDCTIAGTARNGIQALNMIAEVQPDIVIADIDMPVMNGIELLRHIQEKYPAITVIMLSNLEEFQLAQEAMRMRVTDYLTKSMLDPQTLESSLVIAKKEVDSRRGQIHAEVAEHYLLENRRNLLAAIIERFISGGKLNRSEAAILNDHGIFDGWACILIWFNANASDFSEEDEQLLSWKHELVSNLAESSFSDFLLLPKLKNRQSMLLIHWGKGISDNQQQTAIFAERLHSASENIANQKSYVLYTSIFRKEHMQKNCLKQLQDLETHFYLNEPAFAGYNQIDPDQCHHLGLVGLPKRMESELSGLSAVGCNSLFDKAIKRIRETPHEKEEAIWLAEELRYVVSNVFLERNGSDDTLNAYQGYKEIEGLVTREQVVCWLEKLKKEVLDWVKPLAENRSDLVERAKEFVRNNIDKRISLQDAASYAGVSSGYLSTLFKKQEGQSFIEYVNKKKIERACELIKEGGKRLNEISYMLGFENAYYFSKVFRRRTGVTPSEYQNSLK